MEIIDVPCYRNEENLTIYEFCHKYLVERKRRSIVVPDELQYPAVRIKNSIADPSFLYPSEQKIKLRHTVQQFTPVYEHRDEVVSIYSAIGSEIYSRKCIQDISGTVATDTTYTRVLQGATTVSYAAGLNGTFYEDLQRRTKYGWHANCVTSPFYLESLRNQFVDNLHINGGQYFGCAGSVFVIHTEELDSWSINHLISGHAKRWYVTRAQDLNKVYAAFESVMRGIYIIYCFVSLYA